MKKNSCTPINPKKYSCYGLKKIHTRNLITKKNSCLSKIPHPPHNFSNGPSLRVDGKPTVLTKQVHKPCTVTCHITFKTAVNVNIFSAIICSSVLVHFQSQIKPGLHPHLTLVRKRGGVDSTSCVFLFFCYFFQFYQEAIHQGQRKRQGAFKPPPLPILCATVGYEFTCTFKG